MEIQHLPCYFERHSGFLNFAAKAHFYDRMYVTTTKDNNAKYLFFMQDHQDSGGYIVTVRKFVSMDYFYFLFFWASLNSGAQMNSPS